MLKPQIHKSPQPIKTLFAFQKSSFLNGNGHGGLVFLPIQTKPCFNNGKKVRIGFVPSSIKAIATIDTDQTVSVKAVVTVQKTAASLLYDSGVDGGLDKVQDLVGKSLLLELVSGELDPKTGLEKGTVKGFARKKVDAHVDGVVKYEATFAIPPDFGEVGAILVENEHYSEMFLKDIVIDGFINGPLTITCGSWVHSKHKNTQKRVFFTNKSYLPSETPEGLKGFREVELETLRGSGRGERKFTDRIYDYDVYNDIGDPDSNPDLARPVLGGKQHPYPRRCRTGRPPTKADPLTESRSGIFYVPRDEAFSDIKSLTFSAKTVYSVLHALVPSLETAVIDTELGFPFFTAIDSLFNEGVNMPPPKETAGVWKTLVPRLINAVNDTSDHILRFEPPQTMERDKFFWFRDEEFSRQTLAGLNPSCIQVVRSWPLKSELDPKIYGPPESVITTEMIEQEIGGFMSVEEAIKQKKLFILDYHDVFLPYVQKVRELKGTTLYGSRTLFFQTPGGTLRPLAIELTRPPIDGKPQWKQAFAPSWHSTECWLWRLAKAHVLAHDSGYHQLVTHWLRTHCCTEPYIIATNRHLSVMHPIYRLLNPHFRYTMEINALARLLLINADGIIESTFSPRKYSIELSSVAYDKFWRFDYEALPKDLINRGMAVEDPTAPHGLKLTIKDYPYANDGLLIWDAIKEWVSDYVNHFYPKSNLIESDEELQAWWSEIRNVGHGDKKDEPWWPVLKTPNDLIEIITTIVWVTSGHHAAVNFGQYTYAGYFPNRPTIARTNMPTEDPTNEKWKFFHEKPEAMLLQCFPSQIQATKVMAILDVLSNHSPDEEYLGEEMEPAWGEEPFIKGAFEKFSGKLKEIEGIIDERNANMDLKNRNGVGIVPYELLKPFSEAGVTGKGIPYSISI